MTAAKVDIIVIAKDHLDYSRSCVESILSGCQIPFRILFIDNASTDGTPDYLAEVSKRCPAHGAIDVLKNKENIGWTKSLNLAISRSAAPFVIFANNDVEVFPSAIDEMVSIAQSDPTIGAVNPNSNEFDVKKDHANTTLSWKGSTTELFHIAGFFMLIKREVLENVGNFDEAYSPGYFEEMDYSERILQLGYRCVIARGAYVFHHGSKSFLPDEKKMLWERNEKRFYQSWGQDHRIAYVGDRRVLKDARFRNFLIQALLSVVRKNKAYAYLYLPPGTKHYFQPLHVGFRVIELPAGLRWIALYLKTCRGPNRKKIDTVYFSDPVELAFWKKWHILKRVSLQLFPECDTFKS